MRCNCKKSRCLKLYCECFAARKMCDEDCKCTDCANNESHKEERLAAIKTVLERRPDAFHTKILVAAVVTGPTTGPGPAATAALSMRDSMAPVALAHVRGCSCRRTKCTKKYCVCYNTEVKCGEWCRCVGCENGKLDSQFASSQGESSQMSEGTSISTESNRLAMLANIAEIRN